MTSRFALIAALALGACTHGPVLTPGMSAAVTRTATQLNDAALDLRQRRPTALSAVERQPMAEPAAMEDCWAEDVKPAVYQSVMGAVETVPAEVSPDGDVLRPAIYRKAPVAEVIRPRSELRFPAPCPHQMTPEFISSVQRALAARGYFNGTVTGEMDAPTAAAIRAYQTDRGLNSMHLSLDNARALGLIAVDFDDPSAVQDAG